MNPGTPIGEKHTHPIEVTVAALWCDILNRPAPINASDNFFRLGGDSLTMLLFLFRANETFGVELTPATMMDAPELGAVANAIAAAFMRSSRDTQAADAGSSFP